MATAITDYASLKTAVGEWDAADHLADVDVFIDLAEAYLSLKLRTRKMETVADLVPVDGVFTLPSDYVEYKRVVQTGSIRRPLKYIAEDAADEMYPTRESGLANHFMIVEDELTPLPLLANGDDIILNGGFDEDEHWTLDTGVAITAGVASFTTVSNALGATQTYDLVEGTSYEITYTVSNYVEGSVKLALTGGTQVDGTARSANGTYTETLTVAAGNTGIAFLAEGVQTSLDIDDVSAVPLPVVELTYYKKIPALSDSNTTNWLILEHPGLYLHACLLYVAEWRKDDGQLQKESAFVKDYIALIHEVDNRAKFARAAVVLPGATP